MAIAVWRVTSTTVHIQLSNRQQKHPVGPVGPRYVGVSWNYANRMQGIGSRELVCVSNRLLRTACEYVEALQVAAAWSLKIRRQESRSRRALAAWQRHFFRLPAEAAKSLPRGADDLLSERSILLPTRHNIMALAGRIETLSGLSAQVKQMAT